MYLKDSITNPMKSKLSTLKRQAQKSTGLRGHQMRWFTPYGRAGGPFSQRGQCKTCGMEVQLDENPAPNGIDIGGRALALTCAHPMQTIETALNNMAWHIKVADENQSPLSADLVFRYMKVAKDAFDVLDNQYTFKRA